MIVRRWCCGKAPLEGLVGAQQLQRVSFCSESAIRALAQESAWVANSEHIFVLGPASVGKSYVASALAQKACRDGYRVYYTRPRRCSGI
jgi:DNA replication protein DnaC